MMVILCGHFMDWFTVFIS